MADANSIRQAALRRLIWPLRLTWAGLAAEAFVRSFWMVWTYAFLIVAAFAFGLLQLLPPRVLMGVATIAGLGLIWGILLGVKRFSLPSMEDALVRLDQTMPGRPISALIDSPAIGAGDAQAMGVWAAHIARMAERARQARPPEPDLRLSRQDPFGLRFMGATALAMALLFGSSWRVAEIGEAMAAAPQPVPAGPSWEGWVEPPLYTGLPALYLNDIEATEFEVPAGSQVTLRFYGEPGQIQVVQSLQNSPPPPVDSAIQTRRFAVEQSGELRIDGPNPRGWQITMLVDLGPRVELAEPVGVVLPGSFQMTYAAQDDYGIAGGTATLQLTPDAADRRYGLALPAEIRPAEVLSLPLPFSGSRADFSEVLIEDFSQHPFANLPVRLTLDVFDDAGNRGETVIELDRLPGRRFFDPIANALVEMRRDLLWNRRNADRVAQILRAITHEPDGVFPSEDTYRRTRMVIARIEAAPGDISGELRDELAALLWEIAITLEEGELSSALERLRRAEDRLAEAMRRGASDEEIDQLMQELRDAMRDYMQELADNTEFDDGTDQPDRSGETMNMSQADLDEMMRRIEELMQQGRMAEAMEMLQALREMMENMQITQGEGDPNGPITRGQEAMEGLQDTLRDQQGLADEAFRDLQEGGQPRPGQPREDGQQGNSQGGENSESLAERQRRLFEQLRDQAQDLPGAGTPEGDEALRELEEAGRAMRDAIEELERGDLAEALDSQSEVLEALRDSMQALSEALARENGEDPAQGQADGTMQADRPLRDPLGRQSGQGGAFATEDEFEQREEAFRRALDLREEIRRRFAEQERPELELNYLRRLLDRFGQAVE